MQTTPVSIFRVGNLVFLGLAFLTGIEFMVGISGGYLILMVMLALIKTGLVLWYYMHIKKVFSSEEKEG